MVGDSLIRGSACARRRGAAGRTLRRTAATRRIDLVDELAAQAAYGVVDKVFGIRGPTWLTELAGALPFARQYVGEPARTGSPRSRARDLRPGPEDDAGVDDVSFRRPDRKFPEPATAPCHRRQAGTEMLNHIDQSLLETRPKARSRSRRTWSKPPVHARQLAAEGASFTISTAGPGQRRESLCAGCQHRLAGNSRFDACRPFHSPSSAMTKLLELRIDLPWLLPRLKDDGVGHIIYEAERLNPNSADSRPPLPCTQSATRAFRGSSRATSWRRLSPRPNRTGRYSGSRRDFRWVRAIRGRTSRATLDSNEEHRPRDPTNYLLFGVQHSNKSCWGSEPVAMPVLKECLYGGRPAAGPAQGAGARGHRRRSAA